LAATNNLKYQPPSTTLTNLSGITTNQIVFTNNTVWFDTNGSATAATKLATNGILGAAYQSVSYFDLAGAGTTAATAATNGMGKTTGLAAFQNTNFFDLAGAGTAAALAATNGLAPTNYVNSTLVTVYITNFAIPTYRTNYTVSLAGLGVTTNLLIREDLYLVPQSSNPLGLLMTSGTLLRTSMIGGADYAGCPPFAQTTSDGGTTWSVTYDGESHVSFMDTNGSPTTISAIQTAANFKLQSRYSWVKHQ
jgi:YD repeat-containing protein